MINIGIIGAANIAEAFARGVAPSDKVKVVAIASRDIKKAQQFATEFNIEKQFGDYQELLDDDSIDAVYIPLPNSLHAEWAIRAARAKKHILCEKPIAITVTEVRAMYDAAQQNNVVLMEGFPYLSQPQTIEVLTLIKKGEIGEVKNIYADFGFTISGDQKNIRMNPALGGGCMWDAGIYPVSMIQAITGELPVAVFATGTFNGDGIDTAMSATLQYENGIIASLYTNFFASYHRYVRVIGSRGTISCGYANHTNANFSSIEISGEPRPDEPRTFHVPFGDGFLFESETFYNRIKKEDARDQQQYLKQSEQNISVTLEILANARRLKKPLGTTNK
ncbi:MAG: Gfo/Idh/MocA family oxidoreductase [Chitinophagaceae bacterium]